MGPRIILPHSSVPFYGLEVFCIQPTDGVCLCVCMRKRQTDRGERELWRSPGKDSFLLISLVEPLFALKSVWFSEDKLCCYYTHKPSYNLWAHHKVSQGLHFHHGQLRTYLRVNTVTQRKKDEEWHIVVYLTTIYFTMQTVRYILWTLRFTSEKPWPFRTCLFCFVSKQYPKCERPKSYAEKHKFYIPATTESLLSRKVHIQMGKFYFPKTKSNEKHLQSKTS